jgi:hypothetical protein
MDWKEKDMALSIKKAVKFGSKLRFAIYGPAGSGKTYTSLTMAREFGRVCLIDSERRTASKYADIFDFDVIELESFHPNTYIEAIKLAASANVYDVLIIDSISHEWEGSKGALELAGQNFANWAKVTPLHNAFIDAILDSPMHVIATMRAKEKHEMTVNENNKPVVRKLGMEPIQGKGIQYEFDVVGALDMDNNMTIDKTRCSRLAGCVFPQPGSQITDILKPWLDGTPQPITDEQIASIRKAYKLMSKGEPVIEGLDFMSAKRLLSDLTAEYKAAKASA